MPAYYNESHAAAAAQLRDLIARGLIPDGDVDERSIVDVRAGDLRRYTQCHFFAGIGGWPAAMRRAGITDDVGLWTGSCPCQPFSRAGRQKGFDDERHLWPVWHALIAERRPQLVFGEQVASASSWLALVRGDLEALDYAVGAMPFEAASAGADHLRDRYGFVAVDMAVSVGRLAQRQREPGELQGAASPVEGEGDQWERSGSAIVDRGERGFDIGNASRARFPVRSVAEIQRGNLRREETSAGSASHRGVNLADTDLFERQIAVSGGCDEGQAGRWIEDHDPTSRSCGSDVANARGERLSRSSAWHGNAGVSILERDGTRDLGHADGGGSSARQPAAASPRHGDASVSAGDHCEWVIGADGKARRVKSGLRLLAHALPRSMARLGPELEGLARLAGLDRRSLGRAKSARVASLRGLGNAIDLEAFAEFIAASFEAIGDFGMTIALQPILRDAAGGPPLGAGGNAFLDVQGETFWHPLQSYQNASTRIGVLALDNGKWLAMPPGFKIDGRQHDSRECALRAGIAAMIRRARKYARNAAGEGTHWEAGYAGRIIEWALSLKPASRRAAVAEGHPIGDRSSVSPTPPRSDLDAAIGEPAGGKLPGNAGMNESGDTSLTAGSPVASELNQRAYADIDAGATISDPVVSALVEAHGLRKQFPAKHTFSMTTEVKQGRIVTVAACKCGQVIKFGSHVRMNAAIEAHWRRYPVGPMVDGRGDPIKPGDGTQERPAGNVAKPEEHQEDPRHAPPAPSEANSDAAHPAAASDPAPEVSSQDSGAGGVEPGQILVSAEPAQICAGGAGYAEAETGDLTLDWPSYDAFLEGKVITAPMRGIEVPRDALHPWLKPHCKDLVVWALRLGCAAIFASFGLHKTAMQLEWCRQLQRRCGGATLTVVPLGVRHGFIKEALNLGMDVMFVRTTAEFAAACGRGEINHFLTNYESIREGKLDPNRFTAISLDEASVLRSYGSKTFQEFLPLFKDVPFKLVATATPSPNRYKELIHYSGFLGVMDTGLALTRFFQRNSEKAGDLTLYPHKEDEFWMWIHSWAAFLQKPSELGYSDDGYELPPLTIRWHEVPADHSQAEPERDGQTVLFRKGAASLQDAARSRRDSLPARVAKMLELLSEDPDSHRILWHDLEAEREAIEQAVPGVVAITGSGMDIDAREKHLHDFEEGRTRYFATKPILSGSGSNFQYHCHKAVYVGLPGEGYKFNDWIQSVYRLQRFGQQHPVEIDIIYSEDMRAGRAALEEKWALDTAMRARMSEIIAAHGLNTLPLRDALLRAIGVKRVEIRGANFIAINNDAVAECRTWPEASVDLIVTSIPFSNHYEYSPSYRDFGHTDDNGHFWQQMDFLTVELERILKPGRLACIHVKDRVLFGSVTGEGIPTISPFHAEAIMHYRAHGLQYMGMITVATDVVRENNQSYRLGWSENAKDSTKMGVGQPEYVLLFRKRQSDRTRGYADDRVTKVNADLDGVPPDVPTEGYSRARWQLDAHALWRSDGNRQLTPEEFANLDAKAHAKLFAKTCAERAYNYEAHVKIGENLERRGDLTAKFMSIAPGVNHPDIWYDVLRMRTLNMMQQRQGAEKHLCPLQFDIVDRLIERYSNEGELIFDPFGGLMTVPYRALLKKRRGAGVELSATYFMDGVHYLRMAEEQMETPELFDLAEFDQSPPPQRI